MKQRKKQLLAFLLSIIFVVSSFAGLGLKANAEELCEAYGYLYPDDDYYDYFDWTEYRLFKTGNDAEDIIFDNYDKVWTVPSEGVNNGNIAWALDTTSLHNENYYADIPSYKPTRGKIEIGKNEVDTSGNIVMTVDYDDELFSDINNLSYQWYVYDEKPLTFDFKDMKGKNKYWQDPVLNNGKYLFKSKEWTTTEGEGRIQTPITGKLSSQILPDYVIKTGWRSVKITNLSPIRYDRSAVSLTFEDDGISFSTWSNYERWGDGQGTKIAPADSYEVLVYGIQKYERAIPGATGKTLSLPKTDPYYDINKQYYCVISEDVTIEGVPLHLLYSSRKANVKKDIDLSTCLVTVSDMPYTGKAIKPSVTVKNGNVTVDKSKYSVTYTNNTKVGTATATVKANAGSGLKGSKTVNFKITKAKNVIKVNDSIAKAVSSKNQSFNLNAKASFGSLTYKSNNKNVTVSKTGKVTIAKNFIGAAKITIDVKGTSNYSAASKAVNISVNPSKISVAKLTNPSKGAIKVSWKANEKLSGYEIQYTNDSKFKKTVKTVKINKATVNEKEIKNLKKGKTYYVRIRAYKTISGKKYYSDWSAAKSIKIKK
ncbi:MAG: fibronectin type III domain-containing protein [Lachnospiraceae bacterium]|nr:fibronectin type III domain-containing protein [Lachnospiraceae bacterium]